MEYDTELEDSEVNSKFPTEALIDVPVTRHIFRYDLKIGRY